MRLRDALIVVGILAAPGGLAEAQALAEPELLTLPVGSGVRLQTGAAPGHWTRGVLLHADSTSIAMIPEGAPVLGGNQLQLPSASVSRFELKVGSKRHWLAGLAIGGALGLVWGATASVDPNDCGSDSVNFCSRGEALFGMTFVLGGMGSGIGALVKTDRWTPVAIDALAPPAAPRASGTGPRLRAVPGGVELSVGLGF
jgi:hypothetical protein